MTNEIIIRPTLFFKEGSNIEARFLGEDDETLKWYKGVVTKINYYGQDVLGTYVSCHVLYEDGEDVPDSFFYDKDFNDDDNEESWRFEGNISTLIKYMVMNNKEINILKTQLASRNEKIKEIVKQVIDENLEENDDENSEDPFESDDDETPVKSTSLVWRAIKYSTMLGLFTLGVSMMVA